MILDPFITMTAQYCVALVMLAGGLHKVADIGRFAEVISAYRIIPGCLERPVVVLLIGIELGIGTALIVPRVREQAAWGAACLLGLYFAAIALNILRGRRQLDCGCSFHGRAAGLSGSHLVRNVLLVLLAVVASIAESGRIVGLLDRVQITAAVLCLTLIYLSTDSLLANRADVASLEA